MAAGGREKILISGEEVIRAGARVLSVLVARATEEEAPTTTTMINSVTSKMG